MPATGPRTAAGKQTSSRNAFKHGCCSARLLLPGEDPKQWEALKTGWIQEYDPQNEAALALVLQAAEAQWLLTRAQNCFNDAYQSIYQEAHDCNHWTEAHHKLFSRFQRYQSAAERSLQRAFHAAESLRRTYVKQHNTIFNEDLALRRFALTEQRSALQTTLLQSKIDLTQTKTDRLRALPPVRIPPPRGACQKLATEAGPVRPNLAPRRSPQVLA